MQRMSGIGSWARGWLAVVSLAFVVCGCGSKDDADRADAKQTPATTQSTGGRPASIELVNVSYDPTKELYEAINPAFAKSWQAQTGQAVSIRTSHGGSGKQARSILDGNVADVATLGLAYDVNALQKGGLINDKDWQSRLPLNSSPYTSTIVFVVRKGNPKGIKDWNDLTRDGVSVITPDPKSSGGARWNYLAAWGYALRQPGGNDASAREFVRRLFANTPSLESGARRATTQFVHGAGDVLIAWENEALLSVKQSPDKFEIVNPSISILAEPPVAVVDKQVDARGTREAAEAYLKFLYTDDAQRIIVDNFYRPGTDAAKAKFAGRFSTIKVFAIRDLFPTGGWDLAQATHFADKGVFDQIYGMN